MSIALFWAYEIVICVKKMAHYYELGKKAGNTKKAHYGHLQEYISDCSNFSSGAKRETQPTD